MSGLAGPDQEQEPRALSPAPLLSAQMSKVKAGVVGSAHWGVVVSHMAVFCHSIGFETY